MFFLVRIIFFINFGKILCLTLFKEALYFLNTFLTLTPFHQLHILLTQYLIVYMRYLTNNPFNLFYTNVVWIYIILYFFF